MNVALRFAAAASAAVLLLCAPTPTRAADDGPPKPGASTKPPVDMDGVLLDDGRQIEGKFDEKAGQRWVIHPKGGGADVEVSVARIVVAEKENFVEVKGEDAAVAAVWKAAAKNAGEAPLAQAAVLDKGVEWCKKREFVNAPTALLNEIVRLDPTKLADCEARAKAMIPATFPWKEAPDAAKQWMTWADALLASSGEFVGKDDEQNPWSRLQNEPWTDGKTLCFRSKNVLLFIRDESPKACGTSLKLAEATCKALQLYLHDGEPDVCSYDENRLEIRIHKNRKDYLDEVPMKDGKPGKKAEEWTAGFFSPLDGISHFYLDRRGSKDGSIDYRELTRVLTHEFTHHYIEIRWMQGARSAGGYGYFVVEGMAEFIQNQMHKIDTRGLRFDDDKVESILETAAARKQGATSQYLEMETFFDMSQGSFQALSDGPLTVGGKRFPFSERGLWYAQAGALCHFLLTKKGDDIRRKFVEYVQLHYKGHPPTPGWKFVGFTSAKQLDEEFAAFLRTVGG